MNFDLAYLEDATNQHLPLVSQMPSSDAGEEWRSFILTVARVRLNTLFQTVSERKGWQEAELNQTKSPKQSISLSRNLKVPMCLGQRALVTFMSRNICYL